MAPGSPRTSFNSSSLVRFLAKLDIADVADARESFAAKLGQWLDLTDAIALSAALKPPAATPSAAPSPANAAVSEQFARVRTALIDSISANDLSRPGQTRIKLPTPAPGASIDSAADFSPYHRYYLAHQRAMDASIGPLRTAARAALAGLSPRHKQLAALDAVLDEALGARERSLLATVPLLLARRFEHLRRAHQEALADGQAADDPELWMRPGGWLAVFCEDMQNLLLAELDLRLQPVLGLIEALGNE